MLFLLFTLSTSGHCRPRGECVFSCFTNGLLMHCYLTSDDLTSWLDVIALLAPCFVIVLPRGVFSCRSRSSIPWDTAIAVAFFFVSRYSRFGWSLRTLFSLSSWGKRPHAPPSKGFNHSANTITDTNSSKLLKSLFSSANCVLVGVVGCHWWSRSCLRRKV